jgi:hypothetical protein
MVNFKRLSDKAKDLVEKRGGTDALKADAEELKNIAKGQGSIADKAKAAAEALKDPGQRRATTPPAEPMPAPVEAPEPAAEPTSSPVEEAATEPAPEPTPAPGDDAPPKGGNAGA